MSRPDQPSDHRPSQRRRPSGHGPVDAHAVADGDRGDLRHIPRLGPAIIAPESPLRVRFRVLIGALPRRITFLGKAEYLDDWTTRWLFPAVGMIPLDRSGGRAAQVRTRHRHRPARSRANSWVSTPRAPAPSGRLPPSRARPEPLDWHCAPACRSSRSGSSVRTGSNPAIDPYRRCSARPRSGSANPSTRRLCGTARLRPGPPTADRRPHAPHPAARRPGLRRHLHRCGRQRHPAACATECRHRSVELRRT